MEYEEDGIFQSDNRNNLPFCLLCSRYPQFQKGRWSADGGEEGSHMSLPEVSYQHKTAQPFCRSIGSEFADDHN